MRRKGKFLALLLMVVMIVGIFGSCKPASTTSNVAVGSPSKYATPVEIKIPVYDRGTPGQAPVDNNYWTKYVQTNFGDKWNIKVTFVAIPRTTDVDKFNMLLAANNAPDVIDSYDWTTAMSFYNRGVYQTLNLNQIKSFAPEFYKYYGSLLSFGNLAGKQIFLAAARPTAYNSISMIRQDWLDKAGLSMPKNLEDYENTLLKFKELKLGVTTTIPATLNIGSNSSFYYAGYPYDKTLTEKNIALYYDTAVVALNYPAVKARLKMDNQFMNEGLYSPNWALDSDNSKARSDFTNGNAGVFGEYLAQNPPTIQTLIKNVPTAKVSFLPTSALVPTGNVNSGRFDNPFGMLSGINKTCKNPEAVLMYFDWMSNKENLFAMQNGIEGKTYTMGTNGIPATVTYTGEERMNTNNNKDMWCLVSEGKDLGTDAKNLDAQKFSFAYTGYEYLIQAKYDDFQVASKTYVYDFFFNRSITSLTKYGSTLGQKWKADYVKLLTCKTTDFESTYTAAVSDYLSSGFQAILDEKTIAYTDTKAGKFLSAPTSSTSSK
jgi:putative aldouronate transport system substrate-binding protein